MPSEYNDIAQIEAYLTQQMNAKDREAFEHRLQKDAKLRQEVEVYRPLLSGFEVLQEEALATEMQQWEGEWTQVTDKDTDLIEWYLKEELGEMARSRVDQRIQSEPAFAKKVMDYQTLLEGFGALASESMASNMKQWEATKVDHQDARSDATAKVFQLRPLLVRIAAAAVILLLIGVGVQQYMQSQFTNQALVASYYQNLGNDSLMGDKQANADIISRKFQEAHQLLESKNFVSAESAFKNLLEDLDQTDLDPLTRKYIQENAEWNYILAQLGTKKEDQQIFSSLDVIIANSDHEYQNVAKELKKKLNSIWR